ncbi:MULTISPECIES: cell division topological specificity factor MinE [Photobacterium]|uniref:Cell division topological specificity factor n=5 Tax=Photobacterium TaxID=657 RepID=A0A0U1P7C0_PHOLE|nr:MULTISPECIES: cell division topological specificity factor MinE [Photobacterium]KJF82760.1 cell division topological specificity factor MinE [Photobacterium damselae subsp. damselae]MBP2699411.1 cell division topological specificity factor MinE [Vibrio parahaemolyticus]EAR54050.1 cell division topological specificity factor MinE [Photobacterium sp. SKA34]EAS64146.1 cell division topological specificity factor MinE [Photobacterium angustum S14]KJF86296.1 cell division topological specificity
MALLEFFRPKKTKTANVAKERLQIIVAERRSAGQPAPAYLPQLKQDILDVISKYVQIDPNQVSVNLDHKEEDLSVLELNVTLPDEER